MKTLSPEVLLFTSVGVALVPLLVAIGTCYLKFSIVLSLLRSGFGTQQAPSASLVVGLSLVMSCLVMEPVFRDTIDVVSDLSGQQLSSLNLGQLASEGSLVVEPWRQFLVNHSGDRELTTLSVLSSNVKTDSIDGPEVIDRSQVSLVSALASFVLSEIKKGFTIAFFLLLPFFVIDLIVANLLVALGLTMMSPVVVSLPIKILLFLSTDGWLLLARNLVEAYH